MGQQALFWKWGKIETMNHIRISSSSLAHCLIMASVRVEVDSKKTLKPSAVWTALFKRPYQAGTCRPHKRGEFASADRNFLWAAQPGRLEQGGRQLKTSRGRRIKGREVKKCPRQKSRATGDEGANGRGKEEIKGIVRQLRLLGLFWGSGGWAKLSLHVKSRTVAPVKSIKISKVYLRLQFSRQLMISHPWWTHLLNLRFLLFILN